MDILTWALYNHHKPYCRALLWVGSKMIGLVSSGVMINAKTCNDALLDRIGSSDVPDCYIVLGAAVDPIPVLASIPTGIPIIIGGSKKESDTVRQLSESQGCHFLDYSQSTKDEAKRALGYAIQCGYQKPAIMAQDVHCTRATATFIQELIDNQKRDIRLVPKPYLAPGREGLPESLKNLAVIIEAWKLWRYQLKKHVAKRDNIIDYIRLHSK